MNTSGTLKIAVLCLFLFYVTVSAQTGLGCETFELKPHNNVAMFKSPNYPEPYDNSEDVCWHFSSQSSHLRLVMFDLDTERNTDIIAVYDGSSPEGQPFRRYSGHEEYVMESSVTTGPDMYIRFLSDGSVREQGFVGCVCMVPDDDSNDCECSNFRDDSDEPPEYDSDSDSDDDSSDSDRPDGDWSGSWESGEHHGRFSRWHTILTIVGICVAVAVLVGIVVGITVHCCGCSCAHTTQHPDTYAGRRRRGELLAPPGVLPGYVVEADGDTNQTKSGLTTVARPWIVPNQPPAYTAFTLPPAYACTDGTNDGTNDGMVISYIGLSVCDLPAVHGHPAATAAAAAAAPAAEPQDVVVKLPTPTEEDV